MIQLINLCFILFILTFLFNAEIIDVNDDKPVSFFPDNASITVIDVGNVIGA